MKKTLHILGRRAHIARHEIPSAPANGAVRLQSEAGRWAVACEVSSDNGEASRGLQGGHMDRPNMALINLSRRNAGSDLDRDAGFPIPLTH